jgi:sterol O-acyltransferase
MLMKTHAFVRSTAPRILTQKLKDENKRQANCPGFSKFLYFMFAPTLVYRDEYPRYFNFEGLLISFFNHFH